MTAERRSTRSADLRATGRPAASAIHVEGLRMVYGDRRVLDDIAVDIPVGEGVAILGPNGAGKSTLIETLEGIRRPTAGTVQVLGETPSSAPEAWKSRIGVVLQSWRDHGAWRVADLVDYLAAVHRAAGRAEVWPRAEVLAAVGLADRGRQRIRTLSGGQRRRLDVAAALLSRPEVLFLDEPTTGFDPEARRTFHQLMQSISDTTTIIWATHDLAEAQAMCGRILVLDRGRVIADGGPDRLRSEMAGRSTVTWRDADGDHRRELDDPRELVAALSQAPAVSDLEVRKGSLEDAYLAIVASAERSASSESGTADREEIR